MKPCNLAILMGTIVNLIISDSIINFKDFAVLANKWLAEPELLQQKRRLPRFTAD